MTPDPRMPPVRRQTTTVGEVMSPHLLQCSPTTSVSEAARIMARERKSSIVVVDAGNAIGIWTERDALRHDLADASAHRRPIREVMSSPVKSAHVDDDISDIAQRLKSESMRHYVVIDETRRPVGLISQSDVVLNHGVEWFMRLRSVQSILEHPPLLCDADSTVDEIARRMHHENADCAVVRNDADEWGIITERDIVRHIASGPTRATGADIASWPLRAVPAQNSLFHARNLMVAREFRHLGVTDETGQLIGVIGFREILSTIEQSYMEELENALAERESALRASEERYRVLVELSPDAILVSDNRKILFANPACLRLLGISGMNDLREHDLPSFLDPEHQQSPEQRLERIGQAAERGYHGYLEERIRRADGRSVDVELLASAVTYNQQRAYQVVMRDITERKRMEDELRKMARTDPMTGAANRTEFELRISQAIHAVQRYDNHFSVIMLDIDHFKLFNDEYGHEFGDKVLCRLVEAAEACLREVDVFARWGGEEFMVLLPETTLEDAAVVARKILAAIRGIDIGIDARVTASMSAARYEHGEGMQHLLHRLDLALYEAKHAGRNQVVIAESNPAH